MSVEVLRQKHTEVVTEWIAAGALAVAVEVESTMYPNRPGEPFLTPETVRRLESLSRLAEAGNVESLRKAGQVYVRLPAATELLVFGFDPGGVSNRANGVALLHCPPEGEPTAVVNSLGWADEVLTWLEEQVGDRRLDGAGIDTLLTWSTARCGTRPIDQTLRDRYQEVRASILDSNSIYGSMAVQGMAVAMKLRQKWPGLHLNETHPKVLYYALSRPRQKYAYGRGMVDWLLQQFQSGLQLRKPIDNEHEWDALMSAWATWKGLSRAWQADLMDSVPSAERLLYPVGPVSFYWPEEVR